jgi:hypothetical protein
MRDRGIEFSIPALKGVEKILKSERGFKITSKNNDIK